MSHDRPQDEFPELQDALDLWREDTARAAAGVDVYGDLADRVVASVEGNPAGIAPPATPTAARWYAAAAVLLIGIGITGTLVNRTADADGARKPTPIRRWVALDEELIDALAQDPETEPRLGH